MLKEARAQFIEMGDVLGPAGCSKTLGKILGMQIRYDEATDVLQEARLEMKFVEIGRVLGAAQRFQSLGDNLYMQNQYGKTTTVLKEARMKFIGLGDVRKFDPIAS